MRPTLFIAPLVLALASCAPAEPPSTTPTGAVTTVEVTATYRERILLPAGHHLTVKLQDVSLADAPAKTLAEQHLTLDGKGPPYAVTLSVPTSEIRDQNTYAVRAEINDPDGKLRFTTDTRYSVLTQGAGNRADIVMIGVP